MNFSFLADLNESRLFPSRQSAEKMSHDDRIELLYLSLCVLRIMAAEDDSRDYARQYAHRTLQYGSATRWRGGVTDLYVLLTALHDAQDEGDHNRYSLPAKDIETWLRAFNSQLGSATYERTTRRLFMRMDFGLRITETSLKAIRRLVMDWPDIDHYEQQLAATRLLQKLVTLAQKIDLLPEMKRVAQRERLRIPDVEDADLTENATAGATSAASVATNASALGVGFDPDGDWGVYEKNRKTKPVVLRR